MHKKRNVLHWLLIGALVASLGGLVGCGGSDDAVPSLSGGFTKSIVQAGAADNAALFDNQAQSKVQVLLLADEIKGSGYVRSLSFKFFGASTGNMVENVTIKMGHTAPLAGDNLVATFAANVENGKGSLVTVFGPAPLLIPSGADGANFTIPLSGNFNYNGFDDLVIQITTGRSTKATLVRAHATSPLRDVVASADNAALATADFLGQTLPDIKLNFAGGVDVLDQGDTNGWAYPFSNITPTSKVQHLFTAEEIDGAGRINGICLYLRIPEAADRTYTATIRLGHTKRASLVAAFDNNFNSGAPVTVADNVTIFVPAGWPLSGVDNPEFFWLPFTGGAFSYNGTDNLVLEIQVHSASSSSALARTWVRGLDQDASVANRLIGGADNAATGTLNGFHPTIKLRFSGGTTNVITSGGASIWGPFGDTSNNTYQLLYPTSMLGTKGTVTKLGLRLKNNVPAAANFDNIVVRLGYNDNTQLGNSFAANITSGATNVFSGRVSIAAGLKAGDWVEIPLQVPFAYNPTKSLVVETKAPGVASGPFVAGDFYDNYGSIYAYAPSTSTDTPEGLLGAVRDMQLTVQ